MKYGTSIFLKYFEYRIESGIKVLIPKASFMKVKQ